MSHKVGLEREERRSVLVIALLGTLVAFLVLVRPTTISGALIGFSLDVIVVFLSGYVVCMIVYFSDDIWGERLRLAAKKAGLVFLYSYSIAIIPVMIGSGIEANYGGAAGNIAGFLSFGVAGLVILLMSVFKISKVKLD